MAEIIGRVVGADGAPVADATALITAGPGPHPDIAALTGADGVFRLTGLAAGEYEVLVNAEGRPARTRRVRTGAGPHEFRV